jgi:2,3-bisphosphoglycerate-independent phosphoglycerate mutase
MTARKPQYGDDVDLEAEVVVDRRGERITEERAEQLAEEALAQVRAVGE